MSGGHFNYDQYKVDELADSVERLINQSELNKSDCPHYTPETIQEFRRCVSALKVAGVLLQRIDWLVCGDDGEETFHKRLAADMDKLDLIPSP